LAKKIFGPRKRRTREHVIADLSVHHVEGFILEEGHTAQRLDSDYGYDLVLFTYFYSERFDLPKLTAICNTFFVDRRQGCLLPVVSAMSGGHTHDPA
jgi:hypothetical protein